MPDQFLSGADGPSSPFPQETTGSDDNNVSSKKVYPKFPLVRNPQGKRSPRPFQSTPVSPSVCRVEKEDYFGTSRRRGVGPGPRSGDIGTSPESG